MATDLAGLKTALETDARYDAAVRSGKNRDLLALLNSDEAGQTIFLAVPTVDVLDAIGDGVRGLSAAELETLRLYTGKDTVDFNKASIRTELRQIFNAKAAVLDRLTTVASRTRTYGEAFGGTVTLRDLWAVLKDIPKSYMATKAAEG